MRLHLLREGNLLVPADYQTNEGLNLGRWISKQRAQYKKDALSPEKVQRLNAIHMIWDVEASQWETGFSHLQSYHQEFQNTQIAQKYVSPDGFPVGSWLSTQMRNFRSGKLQEYRKIRLQSLGILFPEEKKRA